jgi:acyl-CoA thioester hydrolase
MKTEPYEHKVQYYETDKMGIVHHSNYIRWFEEARVDFLDQVGLPYEKVEETGIICPVVSVECQYHGMTHFGDWVQILPKIEKFNGVRLIISYEVRDKASGELRSSGKSSHCYLDEKGHPVNLKKVNPALYQIYKDAEGC